MIARLPVKITQDMYDRYHARFPGIGAWHRSMRAAVKSSEPLYNAVGRRCRLFGRPWDEHTFKQSLSFKPQSLIADLVNLALWTLWKEFDPHSLQLLQQGYDSILCQVLDKHKDWIVSIIRDTMTIPCEVNGTVMTIPVDVALGYNWGKYHATANPKGMQEL